MALRRHAPRPATRPTENKSATKAGHHVTNLSRAQCPHQKLRADATLAVRRVRYLPLSLPQGIASPCRLAFASRGQKKGPSKAHSSEGPVRRLLALVFRHCAAASLQSCPAQRTPVSARVWRRQHTRNCLPPPAPNSRRPGRQNEGEANHYHHHAPPHTSSATRWGGSAQTAPICVCHHTG